MGPSFLQSPWKILGHTQKTLDPRLDFHLGDFVKPDALVQNDPSFRIAAMACARLLNPRPNFPVDRYPFSQAVEGDGAKTVRPFL